MSSNNRIQRLPVEVDPFRLVEQGRIYHGKIPVGDYPRLKELLFDDAESTKDETLINVTLEFTKTNTGLPVVIGKINSIFKMPCQRCLKMEITPFETELKVVFVVSDDQAERLQEGYDTWLVEDQCLFLKDFIEDEILLAMPYIVMHEACESAKELIEARAEDHPGDDEKNGETQQKDNPFAVLKNIKLN